MMAQTHDLLHESADLSTMKVGEKLTSRYRSNTR
jgi:hypothetical protein